jgi:uncharacterized protein involved in exopolysaccharide biosynthesis
MWGGIPRTLGETDDMAELQALLLTFLKAIGKYRWYAVGISWVVALAGWVVVYRMPDDYQASARVYVDTQSILKPLLAGMTNLPNVEQQVQFMRRTLISRPNVERVMRMVDLDIKTKSVEEHEKLVDELTAQIKVGGTERDDIYTITYNNPNPKLGKEVVQSLLTIFVEGSFGGKKQESDKAVQFIEEQIKSYEEKLAVGENALKDFKIQNMGLLPRQGTDYSSSLSDLTDKLNQAKLEYAESEQARNAIKRQIAGDDPATAAATPSAEAETANSELDNRIQVLEKSLDQLRMQYTEQHPDIVASKRLLAQLQERKKEEGKSRLSRLRNQSTAVPEVEAQLSQLNRDYLINKDNYNKLVERREAARLSGDLTSATDMMSFRVIDPPNTPTLPIGPNRPRLMSAVFGVALLLGLGVAFLMSQIRPTFVTQAALRDTTGVPILGSIGMNWTAGQKVRRRRRLYAFSAAVAVLFTAYGGVMAMLLKH